MNYGLALLFLSFLFVAAIKGTADLVVAISTARYRQAGMPSIEFRANPRQFLAACFLSGFFSVAGILGIVKLFPVLLNHQ